MSKKFSLFYSGITAYLPGVYHAQVALFDEIQHDSLITAADLQKLKNHLNDLKPEHDTYLKVACSLGDRFEIQIPTEEAYFVWREHFTKSFEKKFPITHIDYYYFSFGKQLAEVQQYILHSRACIGLMQQSEFHVKLCRLIEDNLTHIKHLLDKMTTAATILSGEYRQIYFGTYYHFLIRHFERIGVVNFKQVTKEEVKILDEELDYFSSQLTNGFKKCIGMLKNLGI